MREHPAIGAQIVSAIGSLSHLAPAVRAEHERWDGDGYPDGLAGEDVPLASRICFVCDAFHAMTSDRPYRRALTTEEARRELERHAGTQFCPTTVAALMRVLDRDGAPVEPAAQPLGRRPQLPQVRPDRPLEAELRALIAVSSAVAGAHRFDEVLDAVGEQACKVLRAAGISISRYEPEHDQMRTLSNAGELQPGRAGAPGGRDVGADGARPPARQARAAVRDRARPAEPARRGARVPRADRARLGARRADPLRQARLGRARGVLAGRRAAVHDVARALRRGAVRAGRDGDRPRRAVLAARVARLRGPAHAAAEPARARRAPGGGGRARRWRAAPTSRSCSATSTGSRTSTTATATTPATARCRRPGRALADAAGGVPGQLHEPARRRRVLRADGGLRRRRRRARWRATRRSGCRTRPGGPLTFSCGVACLDEEHRRSADLFRAADAAQYAAKRVGGGKLFVAEPGIPTPAIPVPEPWSRRRFRDAGPHEREALVRFLLELLDGDLDGAGELARLEAVAGAFAEAFDAARWAISRRRPGAAEVETLLGAERRDRYADDAPDVRFSVEDESYALADYPLTAAILERGGGFAIEAADEDADPRERALLAEWGFTAVTAAAALAPDGTAWLVELFSDRAHARAAGRAARSCGCCAARPPGAARGPATTPT